MYGRQVILFVDALDLVRLSVAHEAKPFVVGAQALLLGFAAHGVGGQADDKAAFSGSTGQRLDGCRASALATAVDLDVVNH
ncbi:hypothetical protein D3C85_1539260 [compost metagenome]